MGPAVGSSSASGPRASPGGSDGGGQGSGDGEGIRLTDAQEQMIHQLVTAQLQCNKRSFSDQPKVTVLPLLRPGAMTGLAWWGSEGARRAGPWRGWSSRLCLSASVAWAYHGVLIVTPPPPHPSLGPWVQTPSPAMPASSVSPTSRSWPSSRSRRLWTLPSKCLASWSWAARTRSHS